MPKVRLRRVLLDRVLSHARAAGELGLAALITAGIVACGGEFKSGGPGAEAGGEGSASEGGGTFEGGQIEAASCDGPCGIEAANRDAIAIEAVNLDASTAPDVPTVVEAAFFEGGTG